MVLVAHEVLDFVFHKDDGRQNREDRFLAGLHLLVQNLVNLIVSEQACRAVDDAHAIDVVEVVLHSINDNTKLFSGTRGEEVNRVTDRRTIIKLAQQFLSLRAFNARHIHAIIGKHVGEHHGRTTGMSDNGHVLALYLWVHENGTYRSQFLTVLAANNTRLTEQGIHSDIRCGQSTRMRTGSTATSSGTTRLDGSNPTTLVDERAGML